ncbi:WD40 repeat-like protein [Microthyrium microscopicum]|uniref:WD40 repeat-like protein n=1 Tax=Microthyrium microscopicum TaxID=703497 RepID=A0A6A6UN57_9PEZI|nr:WD40 repeat-like protein [Microthyrium microscopicum]
MCFAASFQLDRPLRCASKQYLTTHTIDNAHPTDIFALAPTQTSVLSGSGASSLAIHECTGDFALTQTLTGAHKLGTHHLTAAADGTVAVSAGFGGEVNVWVFDESQTWKSKGSLTEGKGKVGELWAVSLSENGQLLAATAYDGSISMWDMSKVQEGVYTKIREYETKGSFGMSVAVSRDGRFTASGHENGGLYLFNNESGRMLHSLPGLIKPVRTVAFSPENTLLAAAGDSMVIALYDVSCGEQVANLTGHNSWIMSLDFSSTGEWLLSSSYDGKVKIWGMETRVCVATHGESDKPVWCAKWLPRLGRGEQFVVAGENQSISFYREASGG